MTKKVSLITKAEVYSPKYHTAVEFGKNQNKVHWVESEIKMDSDVQDWSTGKVTDDEKAFVTTVLRLFTQTDYDVGSLYADRLIPFFKNSDVRSMLLAFANMETIHTRAYALFTDTIGLGEDFYSEFKEYQAMKDKVDFMVEEVSMKNYTSVAQYIAKQCLMEGVGLFSSFAMLLNFERFGKLKGFADINKFSMRDESLHSNGLAWLFREFCGEHPRIVNDEMKREIYLVAKKVVELEDAFIETVFKNVEIEGLTAEETKDWVRFNCDYRMQQMGFKPIYGIEENPIEWIDWGMGGVNISNFFERDVSDYSKANMSGSYDEFYTDFDKLREDKSE